MANKSSVKYFIMARGLGSIQKKFLFFLSKYLSVGICYSHRKRAQILKNMDREWLKVSERSLDRAIRSLYESKLIDIKENSDGKIKMTLGDNGKKRILEYKLEEMKIKEPFEWDGRWRMVLFDIPSNKKKLRDIFRFHLKRLGFHQYQKSVFIHPYVCKEEINFLLEVYDARRYVRQLLVSEVDNDLHLRKIFKKIT